MTTPGFSRAPDAIERQFVIACSRRVLARTELARAQAAVEEAEAALLTAEQNKLMRERHIDLCDRQITGLLDEALAADQPANA